ncbi:DUF4832 domain-containing protein [Nocardioides glacieisoli]|uniref:DUF4832 domain-containing protein n=1 Tax=Nocardioides glacieisoli TaxID=1168730 RepID=A0A4Q2RWL6_9ACTN|nr:DUF4832 domain-containing protein [Nocardioides glacieisoli]RYB92279.1 DUF4832 domain-containing protein [Nocardioides glacieisoli]
MRTRDGDRLTRMPWRALVASTAALVVALTLAASPSTGRPPVSERTFALAPAGAGADLPNPLRGQYRWFGAEPTPSTVTSNDVYYRDQVYWGRIEKADNAWDFSLIDAGLADAGARGGKFGFRVMAYCPGCWMNFRADFPAVTPPFVALQPGTDVPDWNSPAFLAQWQELMAELGRRYGDDPRLGYVDVGGYGSYGEWHVGDGARISDANGLAVVEAVTNAFPTKHVLINTMTPVEFTLAALRANPNLGLRTDSLGCPDMYSMVAVDKRLQKAWRTRPFFSEWCTRADPVLGAQQVRRFHVSTLSSGNMPWDHASLDARQRSAYATALATAGYRLRLRSLTLPRSIDAGDRIAVRTSWVNQGSAPTYDRWDVRLTFTRNGTATTVSLGDQLRGVIDSSRRRTRVAVPGLRKGRYDVSVSVVDPTGYSAPMYLANAGRTSSGSYRVGSVSVR